MKKHRYALFLASLLLLLVGDVFFPKAEQSAVVMLLLLQNMAAGLFLTSKGQRWAKGFFSLFMFLTVLRLAGEWLGHSSLAERIGEFTFAVYFLLVSLMVFADLYAQRVFSIESVYAVFAGFILMALSFGFAFMLLDNVYPGSLNGVENPSLVIEYQYFSFITLLTIGYGDVTPNTDVARKAVVFASLVGQFYTVFVTAFIIGNYMSAAQSPPPGQAGRPTL